MVSSFLNTPCLLHKHLQKTILGRVFKGIDSDQKTHLLLWQGRDLTHLHTHFKMWGGLDHKVVLIMDANRQKQKVD
jgi:hypothetical protein